MKAVGFITLALLCMAPSASAQVANIDVIDYPGAVGTFVYGISDTGEIAGAYYTAGQVRRGFVLSRNGEFVTIMFPGAKGTWAYKVNARGEVAGTYSDTSNKQHGFVLRNGRFETVDFPGADQTMAYGLNSRGDLTGMYFANGNVAKHYGWALISGRFVTIDAVLTALFSLRVCLSAADNESSRRGYSDQVHLVGHDAVPKHRDALQF